MWCSRVSRTAAALIFLVAAGCQPQIAPPPPTVQAIRVQYTAALAPRLKDLHACAADLTGVGLVVTERPANEIDLSQADLILRFGPPLTAAGYSAAIGEDALVAVVNPANHSTLQPGDLAALFSGQIRTWQDLAPVPGVPPAGTAASTPIQIWTYAVGDDVREAFIQTALAGAAIDLRAAIAPSPQAMLEAVGADPGAIGYVPRAWVTGQVKMVEISGETPAQIPLLALAQSEPQGEARALLACMQKR
jgi:hypothetical protein